MTKLGRDEFGIKFMQCRVEHPLVRKSTKHIKNLKTRKGEEEEVYKEENVKVDVEKQEEQKVCLLGEEKSIEIKGIQVVSARAKAEMSALSTGALAQSSVGVDEKVVDIEKVEWRKVEGVENNEDQGEELGIFQQAKKAAVAVSGGAMVVVGIPLIPFPGKNAIIFGRSSK